MRRAPDGCTPQPNISAHTDVPGHEAGRFVHGGTCPLRGHVQKGGVLGPYCSDQCVGPTPPVLVETVHMGLTLEVQEGSAVVWNFLTRAPEEVPLLDDPIFPARAEVDASTGLVTLYSNWLIYRALELERRVEAKAKSDTEKTARMQADAERQDRARAAKAAALARAEELRMRGLASHIRRGSKIQVVEDPPGFTERQRRIKPKNRTPSLVGTEGWCDHVDTYADPHIFMRLADGSSVRVLRSTVRIVFSDGTLGERDEPPPRLTPKLG